MKERERYNFSHENPGRVSIRRRVERRVPEQVAVEGAETA